MQIRYYSKIIAPIIFLAATFLIPKYSFQMDISTFLTIVALIFAILVGFFIAAATSNYLRLQTLIAQEDATLISIYNLCKILQPASFDQITQAIDTYTAHSLDFEIKDYVENTEKEFDVLIDLLDKIEPKDPTKTYLISNLMDEINQMLEQRQESMLVSRQIVSRDHWVILILLAIVLNMLLLSFRNTQFITNLLISIMMTASYLILILIYEVDSNRFLEEKLSYGGTQRVFKVIGTLKYFPEEAIKNKRIKKPQEKHRIGIKTNSDTREIQVVE